MSMTEQIDLQSGEFPLNGRTRLYPLLGDPIIYARSPDWLSKRMTNPVEKLANRVGSF